MGQPLALEELEIVGYADVLKPTMLPSVVPPAFRLKSGSHALLPPFSLNAGYVCNGTLVPDSELAELKAKGEITLFDRPIPARSGFDLWIDQESQPHYDPRVEAEATLSTIAAQEIENAREALRAGNLEQAENCSSIAISADDRRIEPLAIKAAIRRRRGDPSGERLMAQLAARRADAHAFGLIVNAYTALALVTAPATPAVSRKSPMFRMATLTASAAA